MEGIDKIPDWVGKALTSAAGWVFITIWAALGAILKAGWDAWKHHRLPFKKDKEQFESFLTQENAQVVKFFMENNNPFIGTGVLDAFELFQENLNNPYWSEHQNRKLNSKRKALVASAANMNAFLCNSTQPHSGGGGVILPSNDEQKKRHLASRRFEDDPLKI